jgi:hypothetical protein
VPVGVYAAVFSRALRSLHASRHAGAVMSKPDFMRAFGLTSRQYNAVKFSLDGMESSIVELRPGRIADLQHRIEAAVKKLAKLRDPDPAPPKKPSKRSAGKEPQTFEEQRAQAARAAASLAFKIHNVTRRRADLARRLAALEAEGHPADLLRVAQSVQCPAPSRGERLRLARRLAGGVAREARRAVLRARLEG